MVVIDATDGSTFPWLESSLPPVQEVLQKQLSSCMTYRQHQKPWPCLIHLKVSHFLFPNNHCLFYSTTALCLHCLHRREYTLSTPYDLWEYTLSTPTKIMNLFLTPRNKKMINKVSEEHALRQADLHCAPGGINTKLEQSINYLETKYSNNKISVDVMRTCSRQVKTCYGLMRTCYGHMKTYKDL